MTPLISSYPLLGVLAIRLDGTTRPTGAGGGVTSSFALSAAVSVELASPDGAFTCSDGLAGAPASGRFGAGAFGRACCEAGWGVGASGKPCCAMPARESETTIESKVKKRHGRRIWESLRKELCRIQNC
jgi:hypothetical protein